MKKYILLILPILVLMFGSVSLCASDADIQKLQQVYQNKFNNGLNASVAGQIIDKWTSASNLGNSGGYLAMGQYDVYICSSAYESSSTQYNFDYKSKATNYSPGFTGTLSWNNTPGSINVNKQYYFFVGPWSDFHVSNIDWTDLTYDPTIPTPEIRYVIDTSGVYSSHDGVNGIVINDTIPYVMYLNEVPGENDGSENDLYVYVTTRFWYPIEGQLERKGGFDYFTADRFVKSDYIDMIAFDEFHSAPRGDSSQRYSLDSVSYDLVSKWHNFYTGALTDNGGDLTLTYKGYSSDTQKNQAKWDTKQYLHNAGIYGNRVMIYVCYFQVKDEKVYVSNFAKWYSTQPEVSTTEALSQLIYSEGENANGVSSVVSEEQYSEEEQNTSNNPPLNITDYGTSVTVNNNTGQQYVPNNQSYPTVVSYNHDNLFTQFVGTYQSAGQYLGDFGGFVQATFAWIPGQIWTLIMMGFGMALVIMILKII